MKKPLLLLLFAASYLHAAEPNILVILTDDQGYHDTGYYGTEDIRTPAMDSLAASGMRFDNFYANSCVCSPTRASLLTGCYPDRVGVPGVIRTQEEDSWGYLDPQAVLLPQMLKQAGYHTAIIGKWHLGLESPNTPNERGFDFFHGFLADMMDDYWTHLRCNNNYMRRNQEVVDPKGHATDIFTAWAIDYIKERKSQSSPWFLYLAYNAPHFPIQPPEEWLEKVKTREPQLSEERAKLVAFIEHLDFGIGQVIDALKQTGQYENTLIIFSSDNGGLLSVGANNGPIRGGKGSMYEGGLRVPTVMVWPDKVRPGSSTEQNVLTMDIFPTLCEIASVPIKHKIDARSFLPILLQTKDVLPARDEYFVRREGGSYFVGDTIKALRCGDWKIVKNRIDEPYELYNLSADPLEERNRATSNEAEYEDMKLRIRTQIQQAGAIPWQKRD